MSPTSRNTLMIGGALILIALLLVCGPLSGRFGSGGTDADQAPSVAAGPPADATGSLAAATLGALAGAATAPLVADAGVGDPCARDLEDGAADQLGDSDCPPIGTGADGVEHATAAVVVDDSTANVDAVASDADPAVEDVGVPIVAVVPAVRVVAATRFEPPPVSTGGGDRNIPGALLAVNVPDMAAIAAAATGAFDNATALSGPVTPAGPAVKRFSPPVASPPTSLSSGAPPPFGPGNILRPCDIPGSGCRIVAIAGPTTPTNPNAGSGNPPPFPVP